jgi:hypothetical protein
VLIKAPSPRLATQNCGPSFTEAEVGHAGKSSALAELKTRIGMPIALSQGWSMTGSRKARNCSED